MGDVFSSVGNAIGQVGGLTNGIAKGFTPQNSFQAQSPLDIANLQGQINQSQTNFQGTQDNQQALSQALLSESQGQGANPAQAMLNQATNQNIQQNAGFVSSQKGINPVLAARLAAQNGASMSQQAAGQAATMNANQQLGAQQSLGGLYGQMANQNLQNIQTSGSLANTSSLGAQQINAGTSAQNAAATQKTASGLLNGLGSASSMMMSHGGEVKKMADGGQVDASQSIANSILQAGGVPLWQTGMNIKSPTSGIMPSGGSPMQMAGGPMDSMGGSSAASMAVMAAAHGGPIPAHLHPIAKIYHPNFQAKGTQQLKAKGGGVPGKAKVAGDSPVNDTIKTMLSPGEFVLPRTVMNSEDPAAAAAKFVADHLRKNGRDNAKGSPEEFKMALKKAVGERRGK